MGNTLRYLIVFSMFIILSSCGGDGIPELPTATFTLSGETTQPEATPVPLSPEFIKKNYIDLDQIRAISLFRSSVGHDYSDSVESCRSMKHYFIPYADLDWSAVPIYSPVNGEIIKLAEEWAGTQIQIQPEGYPEYFIVIFHVNLNPEIQVGQEVAAGQDLGTHFSDQTHSDIAVGVSAEEGLSWISYFEVMGEELFATYQLRGVPEPGALIISREDRDVNPLSCEGEMFVGPGPLENYFELNENQ